MPKSSTNGLLIKALKEGSLSPEQAIEQAFPDPFEHINDISIEALRVQSLSTGFRILDDNLVLKEGRPELITLAAGTSHGKSAFMLQIAANVSKTGPVFVFSLEMDRRDLKCRLLSPQLQIPIEKITKGELSKSKLEESKNIFKDLKLHVCTDHQKHISYIQRAAYEGMKRKGRPKLVVIDYLQLVESPGRSVKTYEIADILSKLKSLAKELECPILLGSQLSRACEIRGKQIEMSTGFADYTPMKSDLKDSASIEQDSDVVMFLSRPYLYNRTRPGEADLVIAKNRNGKLESCVLQFTEQQCSFYEPQRNF